MDMNGYKRQEHKVYAVVVGLDCIQGLQSARILASRGVPVIAVAKNRRYYSVRTRVCEQVLFADTGGEGLIECLEELGPALRQKAVLFPCQDKNVDVISRYRQRLEPWYHVMLPADSVVQMMMDKASFYTYAQEKGLPIPPTFILRSREEAEKAAEAIPYPCIIKPNYRLRTWSSHTKLKGVIAADREEFLEHYDRHSPWADALIAQELIQGGDLNHITCNCYYDCQGNPAVTFTSRKLRQWQPKTGQACLSEEVRDDVVVRETLRVYCSVGYRGLGYLEMKRDERSGEYFIIEPNVGRPTGRAAMAEAAGVELLMTMYCDALGLPLPDARQQRYRGIKWIHLLRDLQAALYHLLHRELTLQEWWRSVRGPKVYAIFSWRDPGPFLASIFRAVPTLMSAKERGGVEDDDQ
jgi:predicted ATP-grasp superfamily ATP-dependent carboligase